MDKTNLYALRVAGKLIDRESISCTGKQLKELLIHVEPWVCGCVWYIMDITTNNSVDIPASGDGKQERFSTETLSAFCSRVDQFLSGIFLAVPSGLPQPHLKLDAITEDEPSIDIGDALIEIRAFDTSYFEIYTPLPELAEKIHRLFGVEVERSL
jgi:hypothetical protein